MKNFSNFVEIYYNMFYNINELFIMGEFVVSPILLVTASDSGTFTATVVIAGISIVIGVLLLLILVFNLFGKIVPIIEVKTKAREEKRAARKAERKAKRAAKKAAKKAAEEQPEQTEEVLPAVSSADIKSGSVTQKPSVPVVEPGISGEVVAAITAAVVACEGGTAVIKSIKKKNVAGRNPWAYAATYDNTRPF